MRQNVPSSRRGLFDFTLGFFIPVGLLQLNVPDEKCFRSFQASIVGSAYVTANYIKDILGYSGKVYMIGSTGLQQELEAVGVQPIGLGVIEPSALPEVVRSHTESISIVCFCTCQGTAQPPNQCTQALHAISVFAFPVVYISSFVNILVDGYSSPCGVVYARKFVLQPDDEVFETFTDLANVKIDPEVSLCFTALEKF